MKNKDGKLFEDIIITYISELAKKHDLGIEDICIRCLDGKLVISELCYDGNEGYFLRDLD